MNEENMISAGTTVTDQLLDQYQQAIQRNHEASQQDAHNSGVQGALRMLGTSAGGAILGCFGAILATAPFDVPGTVFTNPKLAAVAIAGVVVGAIGGILVKQRVSQEASDLHAHTQAHLASIQKAVDGLDIPDIKEQIEKRRQAALAQANDNVTQEQGDYARGNATAFAVGVISSAMTRSR